MNTQNINIHILYNVHVYKCETAKQQARVHLHAYCM